MRIVSSALLAGLSILPIASATEYHVSGTGSDSNAGSVSAPWRALQKAADTVQAGDTVLAHTGTYAKVTLKTSGTPSNRITFANFPGENPIIDATGVTPPADNTALILIENLKHITVRGFELRNYKTDDRNLIPTGVMITGACSEITVSNCNEIGRAHV